MDIKSKISKYYTDKIFCKIHRKVGNKTEEQNNGIIINYSNDFILIQEVDDFDIDGFAIFPINTISKIECTNNDKYFNKILHWENIHAKINYELNVDLESWETIFRSVKNWGSMLQLKMKIMLTILLILDQ